MAAVIGALPQALVPGPVRATVFATAAAVVLGRELRIWRVPVPENARLVPEDVQHRAHWGALQFGFEMGTGMRTYSPSALPHLVLAAVVLVVPLPAALAVAAGFAAARWVMPVVSNAWSDDGGWTELWALRGAGGAPAAGVRLRRCAGRRDLDGLVVRAREVLVVHDATCGACARIARDLPRLLRVPVRLRSCRDPELRAAHPTPACRRRPWRVAPRPSAPSAPTAPCAGAPACAPRRRCSGWSGSARCPARSVS